jgi:membrane fusion protein, heavy metal efflux system
MCFAPLFRGSAQAIRLAATVRGRLAMRCARVFLLFVLALSACQESPAATGKPAPPAEVKNAQPETALATIKLTPQAEQRLGLEYAVIARQPVRGTRKLAGQVVVPPGRSMIVSAPFAGIVLPPPGRDLPAVGTAVGQGQVVLRLQPLPGEGEVLRMRADARIAEQRWEAARQRAEAARAGFRNQSVTQRELDAAEAALAEADVARQGARNLWAHLENGSSQAAPSLTAIAMASPRGGLLQNLKVTAGQAVTAGQPLFEVLGQNVLWLKVPVYTGELRSIDRQAPAHIVPLGAWEATTGVAVRPFAGPASGDANAATVDLYYLLDNPGLQFRPEERVTVLLPVTGAAQSLTVPASAIWRDIYGGSWVYENFAPQSYARRRVTVARVADGLALLAAGPPAGTKVVTVGVAELAGTEFGVGH